MPEAREPQIWMQAQLDTVAKELQRAAQHAQRAAQHHADAEVPRASAHTLAIHGHIHTARRILEELATFHANHSHPDD